MTLRFNEFLLEASFNRLAQHTRERNIGMISASRGSLSSEENNKRHNELKKMVRAHGLGFVRAKGRYIENYGKPDARNVDEKALLVVGKKGDDKGHLLHTLKKLGSHFDQDSILHKPHNSKSASLHGTNDSGWPGKGQKHDIGSWKPNRAGEFHSLLKGRKPFAFAEEFYFLNDKSFFVREDQLY